jgi:type IV pilus assembly protein PilB
MKTKSSDNPKQPKGAEPEHRTLLGQILVELGYITIYQLDEVLNIQRSDKEHGKEHKPLGQIALELGFCGPNQLIRAIQVQAEYRKTQEAPKV